MKIHLLKMNLKENKMILLGTNGITYLTIILYIFLAFVFKCLYDMVYKYLHIILKCLFICIVICFYSFFIYVIPVKYLYYEIKPNNYTIEKTNKNVIFQYKIDNVEYKNLSTKIEYYLYDETKDSLYIQINKNIFGKTDSILSSKEIISQRMD